MKSESKMAERVVEWLKNAGWDVYQEVQRFQNSGIADIVAVREVGLKPTRISWIIECKTSLSSAVLDQAVGWIGCADYISVATPSVNPSLVARKVLSGYGIGYIRVNDTVISTRDFPPRLFRHNRKNNILHGLTETHKTFCKAGVYGGGYYSPLKQSVDNLKSYVRKNQGAFLADAIKSIKHHYANDISAKGTIIKWIETGYVRGFRLERDGRKVKIYCDE